MRFVWFWTFWHWSKESFRSGEVLRSPLQGIGSHWDEWFRHEASVGDLKAIAETGREKSHQRQFIAWFYRHWVRETELGKNRMIPEFVLGELANLPPFNQWEAFEKYRRTQDPGGVSALVLAEGSSGEATDVRQIEAIALPADRATEGKHVLAEGFHADREDLETPRLAAMSLLRGKGLLVFLGLWTAAGQRPYPRWLKNGLGLGWLATGGLILYLLLGPDPGGMLRPLTAILTGLWGTLSLTALTMVITQSVLAWQAGKFWCARLEQSQVRLQLKGGLTIRGGSAGLPFCLSMLVALYRSWPDRARQSWLWRRFFHSFQAHSANWAATGMMTAEGNVKPVVIDPKIRACRQHDGIQHFLIPRQRDSAGQKVRTAVAKSNLPTGPSSERAKKSASSSAPLSLPHLPIAAVQVGFAAERATLQIHACRHAAHSLLKMGNLFSRWQVMINGVAVAVTVIMLAAAMDIRAILWPYASPAVTSPSSPTPFYLWVTLDTKHPRYFDVQLESDFWVNRQVNIARYGGADSSVRAEISLRRVTDKPAGDESNGTVWVQRRQLFLTREFSPGERVGCYTLPYLNSLAIPQ
jgi:hypothetical protein